MRPGLLSVLILISIGCLNGCKPTKRTPEPPPPTTNESLATTPRGRQGIEMLTVLIPEQHHPQVLTKGKNKKSTKFPKQK